MSQERIITFLSSKKKIINYTSRATFMVNNSFVVEVTFRNIGERSTAKNYHPFSFLSVFWKVFEKLVNNRIVDHLGKYDLFSDF